MAAQSDLAGLTSQLEETWALLDVLFDRLTETGGWSGRHGDAWTFADVPYHLAYCERDMVAYGIQAGASLPPERRLATRTLGELAAWNEAKFAERSPQQTVEQSLAQCRAARQAVRAALAARTEADLASPVWLFTPPTRGWRTLRYALTWNIGHNYIEFTQLRHYMGLKAPEPSPALNTLGVDFLLSFLPVVVSRERAQNRRFSIGFHIGGNVGSAWRFELDSGAASVRPAEADGADLILSFSPATFLLMFFGKIDVAAAIGSGLIGVVNPEQLAAFGELFPPPAPDQVWEALPTDVDLPEAI